jgi:hypothetical protein
MYVRAALILACAWLCAACAAPPMRSDVSVFHQLRADLPGKTFAFITLEAQDDSAEHEIYRDMVKSHLLASGMQQAERQADSDFLVAIDYFADSPMQPIVHIPAFGQTGVLGSAKTGTLQPHGTANTVQLAPASSTSHERGFTLLMYETRVALHGGDARPIYEGRVSSQGTGELSKVLPTMIAALFQRFPGRSGDMRMARMNCEDCNRAMP